MEFQMKQNRGLFEGIQTKNAICLKIMFIFNFGKISKKIVWSA